MTRKRDQDDIALDQIYAGRERLWVSTYRVDDLGTDVDLFCTITFGPGARKSDEGGRYYASEEAALAGHDAALASYGYRKTGLRRWRFFRRLENFGRSIVNISQRPTSRKSAWIMTTFWFLAAAAATIAILRGSVWSVLIGALDAYMIYNCVVGLIWIHRQVVPLPRS